MALCSIHFRLTFWHIYCHLNLQHRVPLFLEDPDDSEALQATAWKIFSMPIYIDGHRISFQGSACRDGVIYLTTGANQLAAAAGSGINRPEAPALPGPAVCHLAGPGLPSRPEATAAPGPSALPELTGHASSDEALLDCNNGKCSLAFSCSTF